MPKKISISELEVGMLIIDTGLSWIDYPLLYSKEGMIKSKDEIQRIMDEGYGECFIDSASIGEETISTEDLVEAVGGGGNGNSPHLPLERLAQEYPQAKQLYDESLQAAKQFVQAAATGRPLDYDLSEEMVEGVLLSLARHPDALLSLGKLRQFDNYTYTHCVNVAVYAVALARSLGWDHQRLMVLGIAGMFHDLGKTRIPATILNKPKRLTDKEFDVMKRHPIEGYKLLSRDKVLPEEALKGVLQHHEKPNGRGYPNELFLEGIGDMGKVTAVADVYDALTSQRVYKPAMLPHQALRILYEMREKDFAPGLVEAFIKVVGVYPVGSLVRLSDGRLALVTSSNNEDMLRPTVLVIRGETNKPVQRRSISLLEERDLSINECLIPTDYQVDPADFLLPNLN